MIIKDHVYGYWLFLLLSSYLIFQIKNLNILNKMWERNWSNQTFMTNKITYAEEISFGSGAGTLSILISCVRTRFLFLYEPANNVGILTCVCSGDHGCRSGCRLTRRSRDIDHRNRPNWLKSSWVAAAAPTSLKETSLEPRLDLDPLTMISRNLSYNNLNTWNDMLPKYLHQ